VTGNVVELPDGHTLVLEDGFGIEVSCVVGELWITCDGSTRDYLVASGARFTASSHARVLIHALRLSSINIREKQECGPHPDFD
jgi:hypothetical protein